MGATELSSIQPHKSDVNHLWKQKPTTSPPPNGQEPRKDSKNLEEVSTSTKVEIENLEKREQTLKSKKSHEKKTSQVQFQIDYTEKKNQRCHFDQKQKASCHADTDMQQTDIFMRPTDTDTRQTDVNLEKKVQQKIFNTFSENKKLQRNSNLLGMNNFEKSISGSSPYHSLHGNVDHTQMTSR